jgi:uncharacterized protein YndB with AHSA1/START domain
MLPEADLATAELFITRTFDAPRELVFAAWTSPAMMLRWMGPVSHPAVEFEQDLKVGGRWRGRLRPVAGGEDLWQGGEFREIDPPSRLAFTFAWEGDNHPDGPGVPTLVSIELAEDGPGATRMRFRQTGLAGADSADGHTDGWNSTFDRLASLLSGQAPSPQT